MLSEKLTGISESLRELPGQISPAAAQLVRLIRRELDAAADDAAALEAAALAAQGDKEAA